MMMNIVKIKLKYCLYGFALGGVLAVICQGVYLGMNLVHVHDIDGIFIITAWGLLACFGIGQGIQSYSAINKVVENFRYMKRPDYCFILSMGIVLSFMIYGIFLSSSVGMYLSTVPENIFKALLGGIPVIFVGCFSGCKVEKEIATPSKISNVLLDQEITDPEEDYFFENQVDQFIKNLRCCPGSFVFGVEGPWGVGKTSFVNLVCSRLSKENGDNIVIYKFNPLNYEDSNQVLKNFYTGLIAKIREEHFEPELESLLESYMEHVIAAVSEQNFYGVKFKFSHSDSGVEHTIKKLEEALKHCQYKILVVIDDLDRLDFLTIKKIFFLMRNIFHFDNLQFIVCYDRENVIWSAKINLNSENIDEEKIIEFSDKYINKTYRLIFKRKKIRQYIQQLSKEIADSQNMGGTLWDSCMNAILNDCIDEQFFYYQKFFGTPRRIKKIFQQLVLILQDTTQVDTRFDFEGIDLVNLLLIYLYYPTDFKKLYYAETGTQKGTYSFSYAVVEDREKREKKINDIEERIKDFPPEAKFLFSRLFTDKAKLSNFSYDKIYRQACFNDSASIFKEGTLERYLRLIVFSELPMENQLYSTYIRIINDEILSVSTVDALRSVFVNHQSSMMLLWGAIISYDKGIFSRRFSADLYKNLILIAIEQLPIYRVTMNIQGFHTTLIGYIGTLLGKAAGVQDNKFIDFIFEDSGMLFYLLYQRPQKLALFDLFDALYLENIIDVRCGRTGSFDLAKALISKGKSDEYFDAMFYVEDINDLERLELYQFSQHIYEFFCMNFREKNLWREFDMLPLEKFFEFHSEKEKKICLFRFKKFILGEIGNPKKILATYNVSDDAHANTIRMDFNSYLLQQCFNIDELGDSACFNFIEFVLISCLEYEDGVTLYDIKHFSNNSPKPYLGAEFLTCIMMPGLLKDFWKKYRQRIINSNIFIGRYFYIDCDNIINAGLILQVISGSLDYWISDEQSEL